MNQLGEDIKWGKTLKNRNVVENIMIWARMSKERTMKDYCKRTEDEEAEDRDSDGKSSRSETRRGLE